MHKYLLTIEQNTTHIVVITLKYSSKNYISRLQVVKTPTKLIQAQVGFFFFTLPDLSFMFKAERSGLGTLHRATSCWNLMYMLRCLR